MIFSYLIFNKTVIYNAYVKYKANISQVCINSLTKEKLYFYRIMILPNFGGCEIVWSPKLEVHRSHERLNLTRRWVMRES